MDASLRSPSNPKYLPAVVPIAGMMGIFIFSTILYEQREEHIEKHI
jgi:hypothetical protein